LKIHRHSSIGTWAKRRCGLATRQNEVEKEKTENES
jgi:hypothetical protein